MTLWHGRLEGGMDNALAELSISLHYDIRLIVEDVAGSHAHVDGLVGAGILTTHEADVLHGALEQTRGEILSGVLTSTPSDEDIHTLVERRVTELAGDLGARLHTGRSRNDQVATDLRLWTRTALAEVASSVVALQEVLLQRAKDSGSRYLPGYTHLQRAQPILLAHHLAAHAWALSRDVDRLCQSVHRLNVSPLGAGALAGTSLGINPDATAAALSFNHAFTNSLDAVSDRDFVAEALFDIALLGVHLSRMGEEIVLWSTDEFAFVTVDDAFATGSSMLPQKKNADVAELARGKSGRLVGNLTGLLVMLKGLPLSYNRDLQEDKEPLFDAVDQVLLVLRAVTGLYKTLMFHEEAMQGAADAPGAAAIDLAEFLVSHGMPFRQAHAVVGGLVAESLRGGATLSELVANHPELGTEAAALLSPGVAVTNRTSPGGAGPIPVAKQLLQLEEHLKLENKAISALPVLRVR
jgi:argininosuccinate lyase